MREGTEWKRGRAQLWVQGASAKGTRGGSKESGSRNGMQEGNEGSAECECTCKAEKRGGHEVEAKSGYYTMQVSKIPECEMRGRGVRELGHNLTSNTNFTPVQAWVNILSLCLGPVPPQPQPHRTAWSSPRKPIKASGHRRVPGLRHEHQVRPEGHQAPGDALNTLVSQGPTWPWQREVQERLHPGTAIPARFLHELQVAPSQHGQAT